jgi:hypothetical protein
MVEAASMADVDHWAGHLAGLAESQLNGG